jgi:hypothetical protein
MAKQLGPIKLTGQLGGLSFYEMEGNYYVRMKTSHQVDTDPRFEKTYCKGLDFGTASRASKSLRDALGHAVKPFSDTYMASRMTARFVQAVAADETHECGQRQVFARNLDSLKGFEFNKRVSSQAVGFSPAVSIDANTRKIKIALNMPQEVSGSGEAEVSIGVTFINFRKGTHASHNTIYPLSEAAPTEFQANLPADADPEAAIVVTLGITYTAMGERVQAMIIAEVFTALQIMPRSCTIKTKHPEKVVQTIRTTFQSCRLYDKNYVTEKSRATPRQVSPTVLAVRPNSKTQKGRTTFMTVRAPVRRSHPVTFCKCGITSDRTTNDE